MGVRFRQLFPGADVTSMPLCGLSAGWCVRLLCAHWSRSWRYLRLVSVISSLMETQVRAPGYAAHISASPCISGPRHIFETQRLDTENATLQKHQGQRVGPLNYRNVCV